jgi:hypothetical protein
VDPLARPRCGCQAASTRRRGVLRSDRRRGPISRANVGTHRRGPPRPRAAEPGTKFRHVVLAALRHGPMGTTRRSAAIGEPCP